MYLHPAVFVYSSFNCYSKQSAVWGLVFFLSLPSKVPLPKQNNFTRTTMYEKPWEIWALIFKWLK